MDKIVRPIKTPVNRWSIFWLFLSCAVISLGFWARSQNFGTWSWIKPFEVSYLIAKPDKDMPKLKNLVKNLQGSYAISVYHLDDQTWYGLNENLIMPAASIMKVPIMAAALDNLILEETYILNSSDKQSGSGSIEFMDEGTTLTTKELITAMGQKSDNTATSILSREVGDEAVLKILHDWDMTKTDYEQNTMTASDAVKMWKRVYQKPEMWEYLENSIYEDRITLGLPEGTKFVHKVGTDEAVWSDSGIVFAAKPFILVILTKEINREEAERVVPEITKTIWEFEAKSATTLSPSPVPTAPQSK